MMALQLFFMLAAAGIMITLITLVITVCAYCNRENFYDILIQQNLTFILILIKIFQVFHLDKVSFLNSHKELCTLSKQMHNNLICTDQIQLLFCLLC